MPSVDQQTAGERLSVIGGLRGFAKSNRSLRYALAVAVAAAVIAMRRPDALFHAQFIAEDGTIFYAAAHNFGWWRVVSVPYEGYLHLLPRLGAGLATLFPFSMAPLIENLVAIAIETVPVLLLISPVCDKWGSTRFRLVLAGLYLVVPNCGQVIASINESQWILAFAGFLIVTGSAPERRLQRITCITLLVLCSFTGPFSIFLLPFAAWFLFHGRSAWRKSVAAILMSGAIVQGCFILTTTRCHATLGASAKILLSLLGSQVYAGAILGRNNLGLSEASIFIAIAGLLLSLCSRKQLGTLYLFAALILFASLVRPTIEHQPAWPFLAVYPAERYWFLPCLAVVWSIAYGCNSKRQWVAAPTVLLAVLAVVGILRDFHVRPRPDSHFSESVLRYDAAPSGALVKINEVPDGWSFLVIKNPDHGKPQLPLPNKSQGPCGPIFTY